jgi:hypothetical protein
MPRKDTTVSDSESKTLPAGPEQAPAGAASEQAAPAPEHAVGRAPPEQAARGAAPQ